MITNPGLQSKKLKQPLESNQFQFCLLPLEAHSDPTASTDILSLFIKVLESALLSSVNDLQSNTNKTASAFSMKTETDGKLRNLLI